MKHDDASVTSEKKKFIFTATSFVLLDPKVIYSMLILTLKKCITYEKIFNWYAC